MGDREANLLEALFRMDRSFGTGYTALSSFMETPSWGFQGNSFINCAVLYELDSEPFTVLRQIKEIEAQMGRRDEPEYGPDGKRIYHDRPIDIYIIYYGNRKVETPELTVPHPLAAEREFVMKPLSEIIEKE